MNRWYKQSVISGLSDAYATVVSHSGDKTQYHIIVLKVSVYDTKPQ